MGAARLRRDVGRPGEADPDQGGSRRLQSGLHGEAHRRVRRRATDRARRDRDDRRKRLQRERKGFGVARELCRGEMVKALSVRQPWAWLIIYGGKDIENRDWPTSHRGPTLIHAGKQWDIDRKSTRLNSSHIPLSRMPSSA